MKKFLAAIGLMAGFIVLANTAKAALTQNIVLKVTPTGTKSVLASTGTVDLGSVALGATGISGSSVTVTNNGNIVETFGLRIITADTAWTDVAGTTSLAAATDQYNLRAIFNGATAPASGAFGASVTTNDVRFGAGVTQASGTVYAGTETGLNVPPTGTSSRGLWFRMDLPAFTSVATQRQLTVEVSAN